MFKQIGQKCNAWFYDILIESGALVFYLSCFTIYVFVKFLIRPIVGFSMGSGCSDSVNYTKNLRSKKDK